MIDTVEFDPTPGLFFPTWSVDHFPAASFGGPVCGAPETFRSSVTMKKVRLRSSSFFGKILKVQGCIPRSGNSLWQHLDFTHTYQNSNVILHIVPTQQINSLASSKCHFHQFLVSKSEWLRMLRNFNILYITL